MTRNSITEDGVHTLTRLGMRAQRIKALQELEAGDVEMAREQGCSWRMISVALGTSTQSAWEKYRPDHPEQPLGRQGELDLLEAINPSDPGSPIPHAAGCGAHKTIAGYESCPYCGTSPAEK